MSLTSGRRPSVRERDAAGQLLLCVVDALKGKLRVGGCHHFG